MSSPVITPPKARSGIFNRGTPKNPVKGIVLEVLDTVMGVISKGMTRQQCLDKLNSGLVYLERPTTEDNRNLFYKTILECYKPLLENQILKSRLRAPKKEELIQQLDDFKICAESCLRSFDNDLAENIQKKPDMIEIRKRLDRSIYIGNQFYQEQIDDIDNEAGANNVMRELGLKPSAKKAPNVLPPRFTEMPSQLQLSYSKQALGRRTGGNKRTKIDRKKTRRSRR